MTDSSKKTVIGCLILTLVAPIIIWHGFIDMSVWNWFVVPFFHMPWLSLATTIGLECMLSLIKPYRKPDASVAKDRTEMLTEAMAPTFYYTLVLLIAFVAHFCL